MSNVQSFVYSNGKRYLHRFVCGCVVPSFLLFFHLNCTNVIIIRCSCLCCWFSFSFLRSLGESCIWVLILACSQLVHSLRFIAISTILQNLLQFFFVAWFRVVNIFALGLICRHRRTFIRLHCHRRLLLYLVCVTKYLAMTFILCICLSILLCRNEEHDKRTLWFFFRALRV